MSHRVVIVGGGFGGLEAAKRLADAPVEITLIDRRNHHLFQPLLYQVATAGLNPSDIAHPIRSVLRSQANVDVVLGEVVDVGVDSVTLADGSSVAFDHLILAAGARHAYFGNDHWERHAPGLKSVEDALEIRRRVLAAFERAERADDAGAQRAELTFIVVGAGPTGVELAGAIAEIATRTLAQDFRSIDPTTAEVLLIEGVDRVLTAFDERLSTKAERQLERLGVRVETDTMVTAVDADGVTVRGPTGERRIPAATVVWAAGVAASPLGRTLGVELDRAGRVPVDGSLSLAEAGRPNVFVIGDMAAATSDGEPVPGVAPAAVQGAEAAVDAILADLAGDERPRFRYKDKGSLATIGRSAAVAQFGRFRLSGLAAWVLWWAVHIALLIGFRSRALVLFSWGWSWATFRRGARLITTPWRPEVPAVAPRSAPPPSTSPDSPTADSSTSEPSASEPSASGSSTTPASGTRDPSSRPSEPAAPATPATPHR
ncbi:MAG: NAD(P)/FAD-dependent oxidoreductase [Actinomycetota bacterium]